MRARQIVAGYLILQAIGVALWWGLLLRVPDAVFWFQPSAWPRDALLGFWLADSVCLVAGSGLTAMAVLWSKPWGTLALWALAAAVGYPTLYCLGVSIMTDEAWIASAMMAGMAGLTLAMATIQGTEGQQPATVRVTPMSTSGAIGWTLVQVVIFWSVFLWIFPQAIRELEHRLGWQTFAHAYQRTGAGTLFILASMLGLWSAIVMATRGDGTPLPTATAANLVAVGPYRFVRNPMALAGILQGLAVGWSFGSLSVIAYALSGAVAWHIFVRPFEEADLQNRFGDSYAIYKHSVGLWIPRRIPAALTREMQEA